MKIGLMSAWNTNSGASIHAEFIGREWVKMGHNLTVFTFYRYSFHGTAIVGEDEDYVIRCFTTSNYKEPDLDARPFLTTDYEIFVTEDLGMLPYDLLAKIFYPHIKRKAKTVTVIHDGELKKDPRFYQFDWDAIVCFDERYEKWVKTAYPKDRVYVIPYPCHPLKLVSEDEKIKLREKFNLPINRKILFFFGPAAKYAVETIPVYIELSKKYPITLLLVSKNEEALSGFEKAKDKIDVIIKEETPSLSELYNYLHAVDALIFNKPSPRWVVLSSTLYQCIGSGTPIVALSSGFTEDFKDEIFKYKNFDELKNALIDIFEETERFKKIRENAIKFVKERSAEKIARKFIELFEKLLES